MKTKSPPLQSIRNLALALLVASLGSYLIGTNLNDLQTSVIATKTAPPYDGLTTPIKLSPSWTSLTSAEYSMDYSKIPASKMKPFPTYNPTQLLTPTETLGWKSASDLATRDAKITFPTVYMGTYKMDFKENTGSHLAVDIKVPKNTPIYAIGNGIVVKVANLSTGFGVHVVVQHDNFPSFNDPNVKTTYYSSYNHMASAMVSEGDIVLKGQQVGLSGDTGSATTPHLHFQIDNDQAPWHPYWPYTYQESQAAGVDWVEAVNIGLGKEKAMATSINPLMYIQKYLNTTSVPATTTTVSPTISTPPAPTITPTHPAAPTAPVATTPVPVVTPPVITTPPEPVAAPAVSFKVITDGYFVTGVPEKITVEAVDSNGQIVKTYKSTSGVYLSLELGSATFSKTALTNNDFKNGAASMNFTATAPVSVRFKATDGVISGLSDIVQRSLFTDTDNSNALEFLKNYGVINGYKDGTFKPKNSITRAEISSILVASINATPITTGKIPFKDVSLKDWFGKHVLTLSKSKVVSGYKDGTFQPGKNMSRAEFATALLKAMKVVTPTSISQDVMSDVSKTAWYAPSIQYMKDANVIDTTSNFRPNDFITREEVAEMTYRLLVLRLSGQPRYSKNLAVSGTIATQYFSKKS